MVTRRIHSSFPSQPSTTGLLLGVFLLLTRAVLLVRAAAAPFPTWSFQFPNYKMEWNDKTPIDIQMEEQIDNWCDYDCIIVGVMQDYHSTASAFGSTTTSSGNNATTMTKDMDLGMLFEDLDTSNSGILSKWMENEDSKARNNNNNNDDDEDNYGKGSAQKEWIEVSKVCKVDLNGTMRVQRLVIFRIKEDPTKEASKMGRKVGKKLAAQLAKSEKGERWALLLPPPPSQEEEEENANGDTLYSIKPKNQSSLSQSPLASDFITELTISLVSSLYKDTRYRSSKSNNKKTPVPEKPEKAPISLDIVWDQPVFSYGTEPPVAFVTKGKEAIARGRIIASGVFLTKDIVNAPHNVLNSLSLAETAKRLANDHPRLSVNVLNTEDCERHGMGAYLGVARGSETAPQFIHLIYRPPQKQHSKKPLRKLAVVGKGLLFDTGGYNLKRGNMELMKFDCGGAAAVFGAAKAIAELAPDNIEVHFVVAACENMVNERSMVPGDILTASNGKTIEVLNTDAEGRLTMADALVFVDKHLGCEEILELSTLTGNCAAALGTTMAGLWSSNYGLAQNILKAADDTGDKLWLMPMEKEYKEMLKSKLADMNNLGGKYAGATVAALFLQEFVEGDKPFAHIDMAGTVWDMKLGATGFGAKLVTEWVCQNARRAIEQLPDMSDEQEVRTTRKRRGFFSFFTSS